MFEPMNPPPPVTSAFIAVHSTLRRRRLQARAGGTSPPGAVSPRRCRAPPTPRRRQQPAERRRARPRGPGIGCTRGHAPREHEARPPTRSRSASPITPASASIWTYRFWTPHSRPPAGNARSTTSGKRSRASSTYGSNTSGRDDRCQPTPTPGGPERSAVRCRRARCAASTLDALRAGRRRECRRSGGSRRAASPANRGDAATRDRDDMRESAGDWRQDGGNRRRPASAERGHAPAKPRSCGDRAGERQPEHSADGERPAPDRARAPTAAPRDDPGCRRGSAPARRERRDRGARETTASRQPGVPRAKTRAPKNCARATRVATAAPERRRSEHEASALSTAGRARGTASASRAYWQNLRKLTS